MNLRDYAEGNGWQGIAPGIKQKLNETTERKHDSLDSLPSFTVKTSSYATKLKPEVMRVHQRSNLGLWLKLLQSSSLQVIQITKAWRNVTGTCRQVPMSTKLQCVCK